MKEKMKHYESFSSSFDIAKKHEMNLLKLLNATRTHE